VERIVLDSRWVGPERKVNKDKKSPRMRFCATAKG